MSLEKLAVLLAHRRIVVLSGAGCSTESGIPDYRGVSGASRSRTPVRYQEFMARPEARQRYWLRSMAGWPSVAAARPNGAHLALAELERGGRVVGVITQNIDGLHQAAGTIAMVELHGSLARVRCMCCGSIVSRESVQERLVGENSGRIGPSGPLAPDGDSEVATEVLSDFRVPECEQCGGILKPDVVLFGENVSGEVMGHSWRLFEGADVLMVLGSSLEVFSGRRFVLRAARDGRPIVIVNLGPTRADPFAVAKVEGRLGEVIPQLADALLANRHRDHETLKLLNGDR